MNNRPKLPLFNHSKETYGDSFNAHLLEQYKLYVQSAENVSARRLASSSYLLAINAALIALYGFQSASFGQSWWMLGAPIVGISISVLWFLIIKSHADMNCVKFKIIHELEEQLPAAIYKYEWQLAEGGGGKAYRAVTRIEGWVPGVFGGLHAVLGLVIVLGMVGVVGWVG